jgi:hypothetical protein
MPSNPDRDVNARSQVLSKGLYILLDRCLLFAHTYID